MNSAAQTLALTVRQVTRQAARINAYELVHPQGDALPPFEAGAHLDVHPPGAPVRQYSLCNDPAERHRYVIAVLHDANGRGGSRAMHERVTAGSTLTVSPPRNHFALAPQAARHLLVAGGIGITPLKSMIHHLERTGSDYRLVYCLRARELLPFADELQPLAERGRVLLHFDEGRPDRQLDLRGLLQPHEPGTHLYYCGPAGLMAACAKASAHWPRDAVHFEHFAAPPATGPESSGPALRGGFRIHLARSARALDVPPDQSIAEVLEAHGIEIETSCRAGLCGACRVPYSAGDVDHRDLVLTDDERRHCLTTCVSRAHGPELTLDI